MLWPFHLHTRAHPLSLSPLHEYLHVIIRICRRRRRRCRCARRRRRRHCKFGFCHGLFARLCRGQHTHVKRSHAVIIHGAQRGKNISQLNTNAHVHTTASSAHFQRRRDTSKPQLAVLHKRPMIGRKETYYRGKRDLYHRRASARARHFHARARPAMFSQNSVP